MPHSRPYKYIFILRKQAIWSIVAVIGLCIYPISDMFSQREWPDASASGSFFTPADTFNKGRFWAIAGTGTAIYSGALIGLNELWYKQFPRSSFHFFNDWQEWNQMDKAGHLATGYFESVWSYRGAKWTGMSENKAILTGAGVGLLLQTSVEVLDGFSTEWGFSLPDMAFNVLGVGAFYSQQKYWGEQRISFKVSATKRSYADQTIPSNNGKGTTTLMARTSDLYGDHIAETFLKDYNAQTIWMSLNIYDFLKEESNFPKWINLAVGYGAENLYGGFANRWSVDGYNYQLDDRPRYRQIYISPDIDFTKIPTKKPVLKTLFTLLNVFKLPAPAVEFNSQNGVRFIGVHY